MKSIILYSSKTGFTEKYANWIHEETGIDTKPLKAIKQSELKNYDMVIYGGGVHAGIIRGFKKIREMLNDDSKLVVFATGATPQKALEVVENLWKANLSEEMIDKMPHYYFQSGLDYNKMKFGDRLIMKALSKMLSKKNEKTDEESGCEQSISESYDISSKEYIQPLVGKITEIGAIK